MEVVLFLVVVLSLCAIVATSVIFKGLAALGLTLLAIFIALMALGEISEARFKAIALQRAMYTFVVVVAMSFCAVLLPLIVKMFIEIYKGISL